VSYLTQGCQYHDEHNHKYPRYLERHRKEELAPGCRGHILLPSAVTLSSAYSIKCRSVLLSDSGWTAKSDLGSRICDTAPSHDADPGSADTDYSAHRVVLLSFGLVTTLWLASIAFKGLILGLDIVHGSNVQRPLWVSRILALALTIAVGALLLIAEINSRLRTAKD